MTLPGRSSMARNESRMLAPFAALLPCGSNIEYSALERAAKALRVDPTTYQSVEGVKYQITEPTLFRWTIHFGTGRRVEGIVGLFPLDQLIPHEGTTSSLSRRPRHPVQIRPVMALVNEPLPTLEPTGDGVDFHGIDHQIVTPVQPVSFAPERAVIADGHHRVGAAMREGGDPLIMTMIVSADRTDLGADAFHRVFSHSVSLPDAIPGCEVNREPPLDSIHAGRMAVVTQDGSIGISVVDDDAPQVLRGLPAGLAARYVLPGLGFDEADARYVYDIRRALAAVDEGATAVLLPPSDVSSVMRMAVDGMVLPPKSTRFGPKPARGLLMRPLVQ